MEVLVAVVVVAVVVVVLVVLLRTGDPLSIPARHPGTAAHDLTGHRRDQSGGFGGGSGDGGGGGGDC